MTVVAGAAPEPLIAAAAARLDAAGLGTARSDAEWLLAGVLGVGRFEPYVGSRAGIDERTVARYEDLVARRAAGEPLQHLLGWEAFRGLRLCVTPDALIPRPETEMLVDWALELLPRGPAVVVDVGTGTGCIACAIAHERPEVRVLALELSAAAATLAARNAVRLGLHTRVAIVRADLLAPIAGGAVDLLVSNPPYLSQDALAAAPAEVRDREPRLALAGGRDGLDVLRRLIRDARRVLRPRGVLVLETAGPDQVVAAVSLLRAAGYGDVARRADLTGTTRFVSGRMSTGFGS